MRGWPASVIVALIGVLIASWLPANAVAGSYQVLACNYAPEGGNNAWVWSSTDTSQPHYAEHKNCPYRLGGDGGKSDQEGGLSTTDALKLASGAPPDTSAGWSMTAPQGTTIGGIEYERYIGHVADSANSWSPALRADGAIIANETCLDTIQNDESCFIGGPPGEGGEPARISGLSAHRLTLGIVCQAAQGTECITGATEYQTWAAMYGASVTIEDPISPTLSTPSGPLWQSGSANGYHTGVETVTVSAEDLTSGIQSITLSADGTTIETYTATCNYTYTKPCPASTGPQTLSLPTKQLADGAHTVTITATDAANNTSTASEEINVSNDPPPSPTNLPTKETQPESPTYTPTWTGPAESQPGTTPPATTTIPKHHIGEDKRKPRVSATLYGQLLVVRIAATTSGRAQIVVIGSLDDSTVLSVKKRVWLKMGSTTTALELPTRALRAVIRVKVRAGKTAEVVEATRRRR